MSRTHTLYVLVLFVAGLAVAACGGVAVSETPEDLPGTGTEATQAISPTTEAVPTTAAATTEPVPTAVAATTAPEETATTTTGAGEGMTAQDLADAGEPVYAANCAMCHGENGEGGAGPAVIGETVDLSKYTNAAELYVFIQTHALENGQATLTEEDILGVVAFLLVENDLVPPDTPLDIQALTTLQLP